MKIYDQPLPLEMPTGPISDPIEEHTLRWNPRTGYTVLGDLDSDAKANWYADVMRERMARLDMSLEGGASQEALRRHALAVAGWALAIASNATPYDVLDFSDENEARRHHHNLIRDAAAVVTMAGEPHPGDRVELHWGSLVGGK